MKFKLKKAQLTCDLQHLSGNICYIQEIDFIASDYVGVLLRRFYLFSAYFDSHLKGVSWIVSQSLDVTCSLTFANPAGRLCML